MDWCRVVETAASNAKNRLDLWSSIVNDVRAANVAEIGVFKGDFAQHILQHCDSVKKYYMLDPWRHLDDWNKPANKTNDEFARIKEEALAKTKFAACKRVILQGTTSEVGRGLPDQGLDFAYVDGDHTLRGITIDLLKVWPKVRTDGILAGDDFTSCIWQHDQQFEPTLVFPLAVFFSEGIGSIIYGLPFNQYAIIVNHETNAAFEFRDLTGAYKSTDLRDALVMPRKGIMKRALARLKRLVFRR
jgi:Methyltransferase domain